MPSGSLLRDSRKNGQQKNGIHMEIDMIQATFIKLNTITLTTFVQFQGNLTRMEALTYSFVIRERVSS